MWCPKCGGSVLADYNDFFCLQCGWRPNVGVLLPAKKHCVRKKFTPQFNAILLEEYLQETSDATEKLKRNLHERKEFRKMLEHLWRQEDLAQRITLAHVALAECYSAFGVKTAERLENLESFKYLQRFSLDRFINRSRKPTGGRPLSAKITDLSLKLVLCASYQWLRRELVECEMAARSAEYRKIARSTAYTLIRNAHLLSRRILWRLGPDIDSMHTVLTRALWEDTYRPIVIVVNGRIADISY